MLFYSCVSGMVSYRLCLLCARFRLSSQPAHQTIINNHIILLISLPTPTAAFEHKLDHDSIDACYRSAWISGKFMHATRPKAPVRCCNGRIRTRGAQIKIVSPITASSTHPASQPIMGSQHWSSMAAASHRKRSCHDGSDSERATILHRSRVPYIYFSPAALFCE